MCRIVSINLQWNNIPIMKVHNSNIFKGAMHCLQGKPYKFIFKAATAVYICISQ